VDTKDKVKWHSQGRYSLLYKSYYTNVDKDKRVLLMEGHRGMEKEHHKMTCTAGNISG
jgi:hypothetical protein